MEFNKRKRKIKMQEYHVGFTGTRKELSSPQKEGLMKSISNAVTMIEFMTGARIIFHHGDCVGGDKTFHNMILDIMEENQKNIVIHPPEDDKLRAYCGNEKTTILEPKPYLKRNKDIVKQSDILFAVPKSESKRSGTWMTINTAKKDGIPVVIISTCGKISINEFLKN